MSYQLAKTVTWQSGGFCHFTVLDKPGRMGIIVDVRGRCDKRSAPLSVSDLIRLYSLQKPSLVGVAVFAFELLYPYRDRMTQNMERKYKKHSVTPFRGCD